MEKGHEKAAAEGAVGAHEALRLLRLLAPRHVAGVQREHETEHQGLQRGGTGDQRLISCPFDRFKEENRRKSMHSRLERGLLRRDLKGI